MLPRLNLDLICSWRAMADIGRFDLDALPGGDLVRTGLADLESGTLTEEALLLLVARPRLTNLGLEIPLLPKVPKPYEHELYRLIEERNPLGAHAAYNAL